MDSPVSRQEFDALVDRVKRLEAGACFDAIGQRVEWCGAVSHDRLKLCGFNKGHAGLHGWEDPRYANGYPVPTFNPIP